MLVSEETRTLSEQRSHAGTEAKTALPGECSTTDKVVDGGDAKKSLTLEPTPVANEEKQPTQIATGKEQEGKGQGDTAVPDPKRQRRLVLLQQLHLSVEIRSRLEQALRTAQQVREAASKSTSRRQKRSMVTAKELLNARKQDILQLVALTEAAQAGRHSTDGAPGDRIKTGDSNYNQYNQHFLGWGGRLEIPAAATAEEPPRPAARKRTSSTSAAPTQPPPSGVNRQQQQKPVSHKSSSSVAAAESPSGSTTAGGKRRRE